MASVIGGPPAGRPPLGPSPMPAAAMRNVQQLVLLFPLWQNVSDRQLADIAAGLPRLKYLGLSVSTSTKQAIQPPVTV